MLLGKRSKASELSVAGKHGATPGAAAACRISTVFPMSNCTTQIHARFGVIVIRRSAHLKPVGLALSHVLGSKVAHCQVDCTHCDWKPRGNLSQQCDALQKRKQGAKTTALRTRFLRRNEDNAKLDCAHARACVRCTHRIHAEILFKLCIER
jgi:hypothetical protein